jgi:rRNA-processing protein FCF1
MRQVIIDTNALISFVTNRAPGQIPDYGDALIAVTCLVRKGSCVATFDRKLKSALKLGGLPAAEL